MGGSLSVGALAIASSEANAIGAVRVSLLPRRLEIELLAATSYRETFVPGPLTELARFSVPYTAVRGFVRREEGLVLSLDPLVAAPHTRFHLVHFTDLPLEALASVHKRRAWLRALAWLAPLPLALLVVALVPDGLAAGVLGRGALALAVLFAAGFVLRAAARAATFGGPTSARLARIFERRLAERVGLRPAAVHETDPFEVPEPEPPRTIALPRIPVARLAVGAGTVAAFALALAGYKALSSMPKPPPTPEAERGLAVMTEPGALAMAPAPRGEACSCARADSPLWRGGVPVLSVIPIAKHPKAGDPVGVVAPDVDRKKVPRYDFDVAVVNNAAEPLVDVKLVLTFARRNKAGERTNVTDRGLFWEGELGPARSVKWSVKAPGSEVKIDVSDARLLDGKVAPAPAEGFRRLLGSAKPPIRLHAATMLAWLGDPGALEAARGLAGLGAAEEVVKERIVRAASPLRTCDVSVDDAGTLSACVFNAGKADAAKLRLVEVAPEGAGRHVDAVESLEAGTGERVRVAGFGGPVEELAVEAEK
ncbi:MAG TPA: hypothetical protein VL400_17485 [Polyangiaceae bacterium]|nr:hypothetical protein [Polyangiaceae bacterium]